MKIKSYPKSELALLWSGAKTKKEGLSVKSTLNFVNANKELARFQIVFITFAPYFCYLQSLTCKTKAI